MVDNRRKMKREEAVLEKPDVSCLEQHWAAELGSDQDILLDDSRFSYGELTPGRGMIVMPEQHFPVIQSVFSLSFENEIRVKCGDKSAVIGGGEHNIIVFSDLGSLKMSAAECSENSFYIAFSEVGFNQLVGGEYSFLSHFGKNIKHQSPGMLAMRNMHITPEMRSIIYEIIHCKRIGLLKKMFIEAKVLKLLMLQLEQVEITERREGPRLIKEYDVEKIHHAKTILDENISTSISLVELAHRVGLNDFKLKRGFKEIYNTTVYNYLYEVRMQEAKKRLLGTSQPISEIASCCGYEFVQSFIKAFKRKFGIPPEKFRNSTG